jgi:dinuclear metal center YbgI/SA1388 family protein
MTLQEIYNYLDTVSPFELQEKWDNSGLIVGAMEREVVQVVVSLDVDARMIEEAEEGTLFVVHHPLIFGGLSELDFTKYPANLIERLIQKKQSLIAMHTNFDQTHLNRYVFEKVLGFTIASEQPFVCRAEGEWHYHTLLKHLKEALGLDVLRVVGKKETIRTLAMTTGSGASLIDEVEADCFLTGDIKYHDAMEAAASGLSMIDIGHFESERFFPEVLAPHLKNFGLTVIISSSKNPFIYY